MEIIYEDKNFLIVNKPAGLIVHSIEDSEESSVVDWLIKKYPTIKSVGDPSTGSWQGNSRPGIVHRLDKDKSGILLIAKNQEAFEYFKKLFQERKIKKVYGALVYGSIKNDKGFIDMPLGKSKKDFRKRGIKGKTRGELKEAITEYKIIKRFPDYTFIDVFPRTGRTHQIRVHLESIGHPIVCDKLYGPQKAVCPFGLRRHFLHARSLEFTDMDDARVKFEADLPEDLKNILRELRG